MWRTSRSRMEGGKKHIIEAKLWCLPVYRRKLLAAKQVIAEAVPEDNHWSCGLSKEQIMFAKIGHWPGENVMGKLRMELRDKVLERIRASFS